LITHDRAGEEFTVASYESDSSGVLAIHALFDHFQELAGHHAHSLGVGFEKLREGGMAWLLSRIQLQIGSLPRWGDKVHLYTWPKGVDRLFALRDFRLDDAEGMTLVRATSCWLLVDLEKERPCRIQTLGVDLNFPHAEHAISGVPDKIDAREPLTAALEIQVLPSHLDVNDHVNNTHYARWITDCFGVDWQRARKIHSLQMNYLKQVLGEDRISLSTAHDASRPGTHYVQGVRRADGALVVQALVEWE
jgi:medium-chain acyl-[acyl-carrier-protein] hydrolase